MFGVNRPALFWGLVFIALGIVFLLNNFGVLPPTFFNLWPLVVVAAGGWMLWRAVQRQRSGGVVGGMVLMTLGGFWFVENFNRVPGQLFWPVALIGLGVGVLLRNILAPH